MTAPPGAPSLLAIRISVGETGDRYQAELLTGAGDRLAAGTFDLLLPNFGDGSPEPAEQQIREAVLGAYTPGPGRIAMIGTYLAELLNTAGIGAAWHEARKALPAALTVLDIRVAELARLPWELLTDAGVPVAMTKPGLVRGRFPLTVAPGPAPTPIRVLILVGSAKRDLSAESEVAAIQRALACRPWQAHAEVLVEPSVTEFYNRVEELRPDVLHFIGHGRCAPGRGEPVLDLTDADTGEAWSLSAADIRSGSLRWMPRVLVLNACRTAELSDQAGVWSIADAAMEAGALAVVCMQGLVDSQLAVRFSDEFYRELNAGSRVDQAVAQARSIIGRGPARERRDWGLPVLHLGAPPAEVLPIDCPLTDADRQRLTVVPEFVDARRLVDRDVQRRNMWLTDGVGRGLVAVSGAAKMGRTRLVHAALLTCAGQGHHVRYTDLGEARRLTWVEALYAIRDGLPASGSALRDPLPAPAFADFNREIVRLAAGQEPQPGDPTPAEPPRPPFTAATEYAPAFAQRIADRFLQALGRVAADRPLTIAIDHIGGVHQGGVVAEQVASHLSPLLLRPAARGDLGSVRLILVLRDEERDLLTPDVQTLMYEVRVPGFDRRLYPFLQREHFARAGHADDTWHRYEPLVEVAQVGLIEEDWGPHWFTWFDQAVKGGAR